MKHTVWFLIAIMLPLGVFAQWSSNPMENLGIGVAAGDQVIPKMEAASDGGCYISWFDNRSGSYGMYMQRLNSLGEAQWAANGMLISSHPQMSWLVDYDLAVDLNDNAVVVFADIRSGGTNDLDVFAYKIDSDGNFVWGPDGIGLSAAVNSEFEPAPKVTATSDGNFVFVWQKSGATDNLCFQKVSADGVKLWGPDGFAISPATDHSLGAPDIVGADNDAAIVIWKDSFGPFWAPTTELYTQKISSTGDPLWSPVGVLIYNLGQISAWTYPMILSDENGGAFYTWHDSPSLSDFVVRVSHVNTNGALVFPLNGVEASINSFDRLHMNPTLSYISSSDDLYAFWTEENGGQSQYGVYGQRFSPAGDRLWGDGGMEFVGLQSEQISFVRSGATTDGLYVSYFQDPTVIEAAVNAFRIDLDGNLLWGPTLLSAATLGGKDDLLMVINSEGRAFCSWDDARNDNGDIFAQNVNLDGSLGNGTNPPVTVQLTPSNPPIVIPASGGSFDFNIELANTGSDPLTFDVWTMVTLPNSTEYGPIINVTDFNAPGNWIGDRDRTQVVPGNAPAGTYTYDAYIGDYPNTIWAEDHFQFEKTLTGNIGELPESWICWGDDFSTSEDLSGVTQVDFLLISAYPNPFNPSTVISFQQSAFRHVNLSVYDVSGRQVATLVDGWRSAGNHDVTVNASAWPSGVYFAKLQSGEIQQVQKLLLVK
ncbi:MAG: T9SS type A sorting domain-containing protein [bacterium]